MPAEEGGPAGAAGAAAPPSEEKPGNAENQCGSGGGTLVVCGSGDGTLVVSPEDSKDIARSIANDVVAAVLRRSEYEALKVLAWRFPHGTHVTALSTIHNCKAEHHALYVSSEEVIHKQWPDGTIVGESWIAFLLKFPRWRVQDWPCDTAHGDAIVERARRRVGEVEGYNDIVSNSEHFVEECYSGVASSSKVNAGAKTLATAATATGATGAAIALPYAYSTTTVYMLGIIPWGTATVFSGGTVLAGAAVGAAVGTVVVAPTLWAWRRNAREASLGRLPFCILNQSRHHLAVSTYKMDDAYRWIAVMGMAGQSTGDVGSQRILELDPPDDAEEFQVEVSLGEPAAPPAEGWVGSAVGTVTSVAQGVSSLATSLASRVPYLSSSPKENLRAVVRRGSVYRIAELALPPADAGDARPPGPAELLEVARIPRTVLPAYAPGSL